MVSHCIKESASCGNFLRLFRIGTLLQHIFLIIGKHFPDRFIRTDKAAIFISFQDALRTHDADIRYLSSAFHFF